MNYTELKDLIALTVENYEPGFLGAVDGFIKAAEQRIYNSARLPATNNTADLVLAAGNKYLPLPSGFVTVNEVEVKAGTVSVFLLPKDVSFIREAYPDSTEQSVPVFYSMFNDNTLLLGPTPDSAYAVELHYFGYPESIVTAGTTWLGDNFDQCLLYGALVEAGVFLKQDEMQQAFYKERYDSAMALLYDRVTTGNTDLFRTQR